MFTEEEKEKEEGLPVGSNSDWTLMSCGRPMGPSCRMNSEEDSSSETQRYRD